MSGLEILVGVAGIGVTVLVVAAMILITPRGQVDLHAQAAGSEGSNLSRAPGGTPRTGDAPVASNGSRAAAANPPGRGAAGR